MYKLKDIISSGGTNPKINKAIDRYELSKDEKKDIINTIKNAQQGGGDISSTSSLEYWNVNNSDKVLGEIGMLFIQMRYDYNGELYIASMIDYHKSKTGTVYAISIDRTMKIMMDSETITTVGEFLVSNGLSDFSALGWIKITEEEFYDTNGILA